MFKKMILVLFVLIIGLSPVLANDVSSSFIEKNVVIPIKDNLKLDGKITYPDTNQKTFPAVLLIHGSGNLDMDMTIPNSPLTQTCTQKDVKPFKDIAEYLSSRGFLVLRYNKREYQYPKKVKGITWQDTLNDAQSALNFLKKVKLTNKNKIFVAGISQGSVIGPNLALKNKNIAGLVLMGTLSRDLRDALRYQLIERVINWYFNYDTDKDEKLSKEETKSLPSDFKSFLKPSFNICDINHDEFVDSSELRALLELLFYKDVVLPKGHKKDNLPLVMEKDNLPLVMEIIDQISVPILFLHGEKDEQCPLFELYSLIFILEQNKKNNFQYKIFPGVGHVFSPPIKEGNWERPTFGPIQQDVIEYLYQWLKAHS